MLYSVKLANTTDKSCGSVRDSLDPGDDQAGTVEHRCARHRPTDCHRGLDSVRSSGRLDEVQ